MNVARLKMRSEEREGEECDGSCKVQCSKAQWNTCAYSNCLSSALRLQTGLQSRAHFFNPPSSFRLSAPYFYSPSSLFTFFLLHNSSSSKFIIITNRVQFVSFLISHILFSLYHLNSVIVFYWFLLVLYYIINQKFISTL